MAHDLPRGPNRTDAHFILVVSSTDKINCWLWYWRYVRDEGMFAYSASTCTRHRAYHNRNIINEAGSRYAKCLPANKKKDLLSIYKPSTEMTMKILKTDEQH